MTANYHLKFMLELMPSLVGGRGKQINLIHKI